MTEEQGGIEGCCREPLDEKGALPGKAARARKGDQGGERRAGPGIASPYAKD